MYVYFATKKGKTQTQKGPFKGTNSKIVKYKNYFPMAIFYSFYLDSKAFVKAL